MMNQQLFHSLEESEQLTARMLNRLQELKDDVPYCIGGILLEEYLSCMKLAEERIQSVQKSLYRLHEELELDDLLQLGM